MMQIRILAILAASFVLRAESIRGKVSDPSGAPVADATVRLTSRDGLVTRACRTDAIGVCELRDLPAAEYLVSASARGFEPAPAAIARAGEVALTLDLPRVESRVIVTAESIAQSTEETSKSFDVIPADELERRGEFSIAEALRLTPGVRIAQLGGPGSLARIQTRGTRTFDTSVLIDGFRFRDTAAPQGDSMGFLSDFLTVDTERIEVLRGSGSSLYGTHAIGGVVNVVTSRGEGPFHGAVSAEGGGLGMAYATARASGGALRDRIRFAGGLAHMNVRSGVDGNDPARNSTAHGFVSAQASARTTFSGRFFANDSFTGLNATPSARGGLPTEQPVPAIAGVTFNPNLDDPDYHRAARFYSGLAALQHQAAPGVALRAQYQALATDRETRNGPLGPGFQQRFRSVDQWTGRTDTAQARADVTRSRHHIFTGGYEFERERFDNQASNADPNPATRTFARTGISQSSHALFAQDQVRLADSRFQATLGGRWQSFGLRRPTFAGGAPRYDSAPLNAPPDAFTGDAAVAWFARSSGTKLRAHVGNSYRAPSLYERFGTSYFGGSFSPFGDPRLAPERSTALDFGFDQHLAASRVRVSATYFHTWLREVIGFDFSGLISRATDPFGRSSGYRNTGGGIARGAEWSIEANPVRRVRLKSAYTYTKAQERVSALVGGSTRSIRISDHMYSALATVRVTRAFDITADFFAASNYWYPFFTATGSRPFQFAGPRKADLAATYSRPLTDRWVLQVYGRVDNFANRVWFEDGFRVPKAWAVAGLRVQR